MFLACTWDSVIVYDAWLGRPGVVVSATFCRAWVRVRISPLAFTSQSRNPPNTRRCCDVESTSLTLIQRRNNVVCPVGRFPSARNVLYCGESLGHGGSVLGCSVWMAMQSDYNRPHYICRPSLISLLNRVFAETWFHLQYIKISTWHYTYNHTHLARRTQPYKSPHSSTKILVLTLEALKY